MVVKYGEKIMLAVKVLDLALVYQSHKIAVTNVHKIALSSHLLATAETKEKYIDLVPKILWFAVIQSFLYSITRSLQFFLEYSTLLVFISLALTCSTHVIVYSNCYE